jgi:hypothetical protein
MGSFQLVERPNPPDNHHYVWKAPLKHFFKEIDPIKFFPEAINLFLKEASEDELRRILIRFDVLLIETTSTDEESRIAIVSLEIGVFKDPEYRKLLRSIRNDQVPCIIYLGPYWHLLGVNRTMVRDRNIGLGYIIPNVGYIMGTQLIGRDSYPNETEEQIQEIEKDDEIFIIRKQ